MYLLYGKLVYRGKNKETPKELTWNFIYIIKKVFCFIYKFSACFFLLLLLFKMEIRIFIWIDMSDSTTEALNNTKRIKICVCECVITEKINLLFNIVSNTVWSIFDKTYNLFPLNWVLFYIWEIARSKYQNSIKWARLNKIH